MLIVGFATNCSCE